MTRSTADRPPQSLVENFEELAQHAPEAMTLELLSGKIEVKPVPDGDHEAIVLWLLRLCIQQRPELDVWPNKGIKVEAYRKGRARPDGTLAPVDHFAGHGDWSDADGVLMVVEVTSNDWDTDQRDRIDKPDGYAAAEIPVYLLIDRGACTVSVYSDPRDGRYMSRHSHPYGDVVELPDPVGITLETEKLKDYVR